jgi:hypothetical protein
MEYDFNWVYCPECNMTLVFECRVEKDGEKTEEIIGRSAGCWASFSIIEAKMMISCKLYLVSFCHCSQ